MDRRKEESTIATGIKPTNNPIVTLEELSLETPSHIHPTGDPHTPFYAYLKQSGGLKNSIPDTFHYYLKLPREIQLMILEECDPPTLFNLMRTCSNIRSPVERLFWSHRNPWYYASATWIVRATGFPGSPELCPEFGKHIEQVELDCWPVALGYWHSSLLGDIDRVLVFEDPVTYNDQAATKFWARFHQVFPAAKRVIISDGIWKTAFGIHDEFSALFRMSPPNLSVYLSINIQEDRSRPKELSLYQWEANQWKLLHRPWFRTRVLPPRSDVTGVVGRYQRIEWRAEDLANRYTALRQLRAETYEKYHFGGNRHIPFVCPHPGCQEEFKSSGEYLKHLSATVNSHIEGRDSWEFKFPIKYGFPPLLPKEVEDQLAALEIEHLRAKANLAKERDRLRQEEWGEPASEKRRLYQKKFDTQLENDPVYKCEGNPRSTRIWFSLLQHWLVETQRQALKERLRS
jgi:hypothetical protein